MDSDLSAWLNPEKASEKQKEDSSAVSFSKKKSMLEKILKLIEKQPIRPTDYPIVPETASPGILLDIEYDGDRGLARLKIFDPDTMQIYEWFDNSGHQPYCLTDLSQKELSQNQQVVGHPGFERFETTRKFDLLHDTELALTTIVTRDPLAIGGRQDSIREIIGRDHAWEADIRYHHCYTMDRSLVPGLFYRTQQRKLDSVAQKYSLEDAEKIRKLFEAGTEASKLIEEYLPLFLTPTINLPRLSFDIEVASPAIDRIPDPTEAPFPVIAASIIDDTGQGIVCLLRQDSSAEAIKPNLPPSVQVRYFSEEKPLIEWLFRIIWRTPLLFTYNGDNFDLRYLFNRAKKLDIATSDIPFSLRGTRRGQPEVQLHYGVHVDLYRFFHNRSIQIYAFQNSYREVTLEDVSQALLGEGKREIPDLISDLPLNVLAEYNWQDANLTIRLTQFDNNLVLNLIIMLMRISHQGMHDLTRTAVSSWIRSLLYYEHRQQNYLIPRQDQIAAMKGEAITEAIIKGKKYKGAIVVEPKAGVHFDVTVLDFASLYPSIMKAYNLSYETVRCNHPECQSNQVPDTPHWICTRREGLTSLIIGIIRDVRVEYFKPRAKDKTLTSAQRSWFSVIEQALKVYLNACLPFDEEVIIRTPTGQIEKREIVSLKDAWKTLEILSVDANSNNGGFGTPIFVPIKGFAETGATKILRISLSDGRLLRCTSNHVVPVYTTQTGRRYGKEFRIHEIPAGDLKIGDELLLCNRIPLSESVPNSLFIPDIIDSSNLLIGMERKVYRRFSYRRNQATDNEVIQVINRKFEYSKGRKLYKVYWTDLSEEEKDVIRKATPGLLRAKITKNPPSPSFWQDLYIPLSKEFFQLLGWYIAEGYGQQNRFAITQSSEKNPENVHEILSLLHQLNWPAVLYGDKSIVIHSNVLSSVISRLCGSHANNKRIPLFLLNRMRAEALLETYFKGDGIFNTHGRRRYSTISQQLTKDLIFLLSALGRFTSIHRDSNITRIVETLGRNYARKYRGLIDFNGTNLIQVKSIDVEPKPQPVFDIETGNGWFVTTNGIVTHNSYGVLGASHFPLYCAPAAESITAYGRFAISETIKKAEELGVVVLYGDTDSLFLASPSREQLDRLVEYSEKALKVELDVEKVYRYVALSSRKKNYLGVTREGRVDIKGLTGKKRNTPAFLQEAFMQMVDILQQVKDETEFAGAKERILRLAREKLTMLERREFQVEDLAIRVQLTKPISAYTKTTPQHVKAAKQLEAAGKEVMAGDIISFVKTSDGVKPVEQATVQDIDTSKYKDLVRSAFEQVLDALGIEWFDTIGMRRLDTFFG